MSSICHYKLCCHGHLCRFLCEHAFISLEYIPRSEIAGFYGNSLTIEELSGSSSLTWIMGVDCDWPPCFLLYTTVQSSAPYPVPSPATSRLLS